MVKIRVYIMSIFCDKLIKAYYCLDDRQGER